MMDEIGRWMLLAMLLMLVSFNWVVAGYAWWSEGLGVALGCAFNPLSALAWAYRSAPRLFRAYFGVLGLFAFAVVLVSLR